MTPEQQEIHRKKEEIKEIEQQLTDLEASYADYCVQLKNFESDYLRVIGPVYMRLDRWKMRIEASEMMIIRLRDVRDGVRSLPDDPFLWEIDCAQKIRNKWSISQAVFEPATAARVPQSKELQKEAKGLYRELARRFHPDLAETEEIRQARTEVMAEINQAYRDQDLEKLKEMRR